MGGTTYGFCFSGNESFLENPELWTEVHHRLITAIANAIEPQLSREYRVAIEKRTYLGDIEDSVLIGIPDVAVTTNCRKTSKEVDCDNYNAMVLLISNFV